VGDQVTLRAGAREVTLPVSVADLPDDVVWTPTTRAFSAPAGSEVHVDLAEGARA
jgi:hypothetical protein